MSRIPALLVCMLALLATGPVAAQDAAQPAPAARDARNRPAPKVPAGTRSLKVGVFELPPYAMRLNQDDWSGIAVTLFREAAAKMGVDHDFVEYPDVASAVRAVAEGECDVLAVGLDPTPERESEFDFSHAFEQSGTSVAVQLDHSPSLLRVAGQILDSKLLSVLGWVIGCMVAVAVLMTLIERRRTQSHFAGSWLKSLGESLWWSITTMSTVGYGDRVPVSWRGKLLGGVWMLVAFALMSILAGVIASDLTVSRFQPTISSVKQLPKVRVAAVKDSAALMDGAAQGLKMRAMPGLPESLEALQRREVDAVLGDTAALRYLVRENYALDMVVLPDPIVVEYACFPLSPRLPREVHDAFNYWVLRIIESASWQSYRRVIAGDN